MGLCWGGTSSRGRDKESSASELEGRNKDRGPEKESFDPRYEGMLPETRCGSGVFSTQKISTLIKKKNRCR